MKNGLFKNKIIFDAEGGRHFSKLFLRFYKRSLFITKACLPLGAVLSHVHLIQQLGSYENRFLCNKFVREFTIRERSEAN